MNARRDPERLIHAFLMEGQTELADQVYDAVRAETERKRQRVVIGPRRMPIMNKFVPIGLGVAALVMALVIGTQFLGRPAPDGAGGAPSATPSATAEPSPSVAAPSSTPEGFLPEGPHILMSGESVDGMPPLPITVTIPAPNWYGEPGGGILVKNDNPDAPAGAGMIVFTGDLFVFGDPCRWSTTRPDTPATTVDELVAALAAQASRDASEPVVITVGGYAGKSITLHVPDEAVFSECDRGTFGSWGVPGPDLTPFRYHQDPGQIDELWIVDVDGELAVIDTGYYEGTPQIVRDELAAIVDSMTFEAP
jgi:hypothetical protein